MLSHRLGLVPVRVDPDLFESKSGWSAAIVRISISVSFSDRHGHLLAVWPPQLRVAAGVEWGCNEMSGHVLQSASCCAGSEKSTEKTTAVFKLDIRCSWQPDATMAHEKGAAPSSGHWLQRMAAVVLRSSRLHAVACQWLAKRLPAASQHCEVCRCDAAPGCSDVRGPEVAAGRQRDAGGDRLPL